MNEREREGTTTTLIRTQFTHTVSFVVSVSHFMLKDTHRVVLKEEGRNSRDEQLKNRDNNR